MSKIYTKTGDDGTTGLLTGERVRKSDIRLEIYGQVDHLNSMLGLLKKNLEIEKIFKEEEDFVVLLQNQLFSLGSLLACPGDSWEKFKLEFISIDTINLIESSIDSFENQVPDLKNFILPSGSTASIYAHLCRTQTRNIERKMSMIDIDKLPDLGLEFINRLSDYFFNLSRYINFKQGLNEIEWTK